MLNIFLFFDKLFLYESLILYIPLSLLLSWLNLNYFRFGPHHKLFIQEGGFWLWFTGRLRKKRKEVSCDVALFFLQQLLFFILYLGYLLRLPFVQFLVLRRCFRFYIFEWKLLYYFLSLLLRLVLNHHLLFPHL